MAAMTTAEVIFKVSLSEIIHLTSSKLPAKFDAFVRSVTIISLSHPTNGGTTSATIRWCNGASREVFRKKRLFPESGY
jgi:hypothetical protein